MVRVHNRLTTNQNLLAEIERLKNKQKIDAPITDLEIQPQLVSIIEALTQDLEKSNPFPRPLLYANTLLDGAWLLEYSTAREIRALKRLPLGFQVGKVYQIIDVNNGSFENKAWVRHSSGLLSGYVRVTATFEPAKQDDDIFPDRQINIDFKQRFLGIEKILGIKTNLLDPFRVVKAKNPVGRIPSLNLTYIDETIRVGRGGDGSLYILSRAKM